MLREGIGAPGRLIGRAALSLAAAGLFLWLLADRLQSLDLAATRAAFTALEAWQWLAATLATGLSFWALGRYDDVMHRHLRTGRHGAASVRAGAAAIAVSQSLGLGLVTGALMRWRLLPGMSLWQATRLTAAVSGGFFLAWGIVTLLALAALPGPFQPVALWGLPALAMLPLLWRLPVPLPNAFLSLRLLGFAALDLGAATLALWLLCPAGASPGLAALLPAYLLALGAGLVSGAPGGLGAFEVTLLGLLPGTPEAPMVAAILAFRAIYYALPALLGTLALLRPGPPPRRTPLPPAPHLVAHAPRAECGLLRQGHLSLERMGAAIWLIGRSPHLLTAMFDPVTGPADLSALARGARAEGRWPVIYKASARPAARARAEGLRSLRIAREAVLAPQSFTLTGSARAGLRRKLRQAEAAGLRIGEALPDALPMAEMAVLNRDWSLMRGGERGFSMGRFAPDYLRRQRVFLAWQGARLMAFASFHAGPREWVLDLMRQTRDAPEGCQHALIIAALEVARREGQTRLSLAALPDLAFLPARLRRRFEAPSAGLAQFKHSFAPRCEPLYLIVPHLPAAALAALDLSRAIRHPPPLPDTG
ncbi:MAG: DUF2156 domain-containing protein [Gemmobacter sp.]|uniref:phosphatidylglycerol lysyltransferase domain-containing protein n=1 Tax=Gemmobacter sp. TaxID=1898957 RepID=UPI001A4FAAAD|nr:phosphatidylglycerol lysyltransferase domain-containing protein [Gemmobacter sp.]MBL8560719.1 DUF2156 domain-containing protein [Gemmobacter sp.]